MTLVYSVREGSHSDIDLIVAYWSSCDRAYLHSLGADINKMPGTNQFRASLARQFDTDYIDKEGYALIWMRNEHPIGHCNINQMIFGQRANMHLHIWNSTDRLNGAGTVLVSQSIPYFFNNFQLQELYCEPYARNIAPNRTLPKVGFEFVKTYTTVPGYINFEQEVNQWVITRNRFLDLNL